MKKKHILLLNFLFCSIIGFAQDKINQKTTIPQVQAALSGQAKSVDPDFLKAAKFNSKAFGDTLYYQSFDSTGWSIFNNNPNNFLWRWDTIYPNGQFSNPNNIITSTTASNGFMVLPADFYNTPIIMGVAMSTGFELDSIDLTKNGLYPNGISSVWVTYQQAMRYCCSGANKLVLQVSADNFVSFQEYDASNAIAVNAASGTTINTINISTAAANATNIKIRFLADGMSHYYWMIDDVAVVEGPENDAALQSPYVEFNYDYAYNPFYGQTPYDLFPPLRLTSLNYNAGSNTLTNVRLEGDFIHVSGPSGNSGVGIVHSTTSSAVPLNPYQFDTALTNPQHFVPSLLGEYRVDFKVDSDSLDENPLNNFYSQSFSTSDTVFARDDNGYAGGTGPRSYNRNGRIGGTVGDKFGTMYIVESRTGNGGLIKVPTSITFAVSSDPANIGVEIVPKIWSYNEDSLFTATGSIAAAFSGGEVASSFIPYTILSADTNTLLTLLLDNGPAVFNGLDSGQYVVGWEVTNTNGGNSFEVYEDASSGRFQPPATCFIDLAHQPGWGWVDANPVIRLNMGNLLYTSLRSEADSNMNISVQPNPSNGEFSLTFQTNEKTTFQLTIRNTIGQLVHSEKIIFQGINTKQFNFSDLEKGVYYISLQNESENRVETVILH
ncbi:MAG: hypothetical protein ACJAQ2_000886 [Vicingaceae bacterium]|jgi:hypothetical protein